MRKQFLAGAAVVTEAVGDDRVRELWEAPSVLADQTVGSLVGHLARGSVWVVDDYLDRPVPGDAEVDFETAAQYFHELAGRLEPTDHAAIRQRGAEVASLGQSEILRLVTERTAVLRARLETEPHDRKIVVYDGLVMGLDDYLYTRIVEQVVHLDDLARSISGDGWINPPDAEALVVACGAELGRRRFGGQAMIRALYRGIESDMILPVM